MNRTQHILCGLFALPLMLSGCGADNNDTQKDEATITPPDSFNTLDVPVGFEATYINLESGTSSTDSSQPWHIAYKRYNGFSLNSGVSGNGNVQGCIAWQADGAYNNQGQPVKAVIENLSASNTGAAFEQVNSNRCDNLSSDTLSTQISMTDWLVASYGPQGPSFSASTEHSNGWIVRSASSDGNGIHQYARVKVEDVAYQMGQPTIRKLKLSRELWDSNSESFTPAVTSDWLDFSTERQYWDLETNAVVVSTSDWELSVTYNSAARSWDIQVNAGISGPGQAGIGLVTLPESHAFAVTNPTNPQQVYTFFTDKADSIINKPGNFGPLEYNLKGTHDLTANFTVYRISDGTSDYKVQLLSNYGADGLLGSGNLHFRYAPL